MEQLPPMMDYNIRHGRTYMYFKGEPLYPFGYGLSYSRFRYSGLKLSSRQLEADGKITVSFNVTNVGPYAGEEVAQLYVRHTDSKVERPGKELRGFQRVSLQANQTKTVQIQLPAHRLTYWNEAAKKWEFERDHLEFLVGASSSDIRLHDSISAQ